MSFLSYSFKRLTANSEVNTFASAIPFNYNNYYNSGTIFNPFNFNNDFIFNNYPAQQLTGLTNLYSILFGTNDKETSIFHKNSSNSKLLPSLKEAGYNSAKGEKLASIAIKNSVSNFTGWCAKYVKRDIEEAGLGRYQQGHAHECDTILDNNPNFKEISTDGLNLSDLPAGCILIYERGVSGYSNKYGHVEITDGNGNAYSDGKTTSIKPGAKVYIPVSRNYA